MKYTRIYSDASGISHFQNIEVELAARGPIGLMSEAVATTGLIFRQHPGDQDWDWHTTPRRQYMIMLEGFVDIEVGSGETRRFGPSDILLLDDTTGQGHSSKSPDGNPRSCIFVTLD